MVCSTALLLLLPALLPSLLPSPLHSTFIYSHQGPWQGAIDGFRKNSSYWKEMMEATKTKATSITLPRTSETTITPQPLSHQQQHTLVLLSQVCPSLLLPCPSLGLIRGIVALEQNRKRFRGQRLRVRTIFG